MELLEQLERDHPLKSEAVEPLNHWNGFHLILHEPESRMRGFSLQDNLVCIISTRERVFGKRYVKKIPISPGYRFHHSRF